MDMMTFELVSTAAQWAEFRLWCLVGLAGGMGAHYFARFSSWRKGTVTARKAMIWQVGLVTALFVATGYTQTLYSFNQVEVLGNGEVLLSYPTGKQRQLMVQGGFANPQRGSQCIITLNDGEQVYKSDMIAKDRCLQVLNAVQQSIPGF